MKEEDLIIFMNQEVSSYQKTGQDSAIRTCRATLKKVISFNRCNTMPFSELTREWLKEFEAYLRKELSENSVSTYMRMLQAVYNKAVYEQRTGFVAYLFKKVFKGRAPSRSRALTQEDVRVVMLVPEEQLPKNMVRTRDLFILMFLLQGIPFVDLMHLRRSNLQGNKLTYRRHKTGKPVTVIVEPQAMAIIERYRDKSPHAPYLFPFLTDTDKEGLRQYESVLRQFNYRLKQLGVLLGLSIPLTSYCARHSWASFANYCDIDRKLISEGMGHSSIQVTETYFKAHEIEDIREMNRQVIAYAMMSRLRK